MDSLRSDLLQTTEKIITLIKERSFLVKQIQEYKKEHNIEIFDAKRENLIFEKLADQLVLLTDEELYVFSLLQQIQTGAGYPQWSEKLHLKVFPEHTLAGVNPFILKWGRPDYFAKLQFSSAFDFVVKI